eukprot:TRINITY_DN4364_c0_g6_i1.p1 TRINITY_DN4364_c0_g6~~TRINITY_DN4364_c0_g6_i1.p1  ORF type:complete len:331 (-),score=39.12 TRINITY_DN4364_c0_g6_i1:185-1177(-)
MGAMVVASFLRGASAGALALALMQLKPMSSWSNKTQVVLCVLASYLPSYLDGSEYKPAPRRSLAFSALARKLFGLVMPRLFNLKKVVMEDRSKLSECKQCIVGVHPHGVMSYDHIMLVSGMLDELNVVLPHTRRSALSANILFKIPILREIALAVGAVDASRRTANKCLKEGLSLSVVPGGEREMLLAQRGPIEQLVLKKRMGFVRLALEHGVPLVPVYCFGEAQLYHQSTFLFGLRSWLQRTVGAAIPLHYGPYGIPGLHFNSPVQLVVGTPVEMPRVPEPPKDAPADERQSYTKELEKHHARYVQEVQNLFERHKEASGYGHVSLHLL